MILTKPVVRSVPSPNRNGYSAPHNPKFVVWHITAGSGNSAVSWLSSPASNASANYVNMESGEIIELVRPDESAWANGDVQNPNLTNPIIAAVAKSGRNMNTASISIENAGQSSYGKGGSLTGAQIASLINLTAWLCKRFGIPPDREHIVPHAWINDVTRHNCPGFSEQEYATWIGRIAALVNGTSKLPLVEEAQEDDMQLPAPGTAETRIAPDGTPYSIINWAGKATKILGTNFADVGVSLVGADGKTEYDRSIQRGEMQQYNTRGQ